MLSGPQRPIVLMPRLPGAPVADSVAPHNPDLGVMLAYAPLHALLFGLPGDEPGPPVLVMTSGNLAGEPICFADDDALERLSHLADGWLMHDRAILVPCDDSVMRVLGGSAIDEAIELPIRRSRGYAPLPIALPVPVPPTLAVGGDLKNTMAVADGKYAWLSQHIGDMDDLATLSAFDCGSATPAGVDRRSHRRFSSPTPIRCTGRPDGRHRNADGRPVRTVQHHHAHIAAVMAEHGLDGSAQVLGFAFDGTGYGPDGAVWGGEVLLANYKGFQRLAHLKYVPMAGGDISVLRPYRMALAHLWAAGIAWDPDLPPVSACPPDERRALRAPAGNRFRLRADVEHGPTVRRRVGLAGVRQVVAYEAQAAIELEGLSRGVDCGATTYAFDIDDRDATAIHRPRSRARRRGPRPARRRGRRRDRRAIPPGGRRPDRRPRLRGTRCGADRRAVRRRVPERAAART